LPVHLMTGTGYGLEPDWKHGMYQGLDLVVQGVSYDLSRPQDAARMWGMVDAVGRFTYDGRTGYGLNEYWALGDHPSFRPAAGQASRRTSRTAVTPSRTAARATKMPDSMPWKAQ
jgi:hypothetical protein